MKSIADQVSIQFSEIKVVDRATGLFVVEIIQAHIGFLHLLRSVIEWSCGMRPGSYGDCHFRCEHRSVNTLDALRDDLKYF